MHQLAANSSAAPSACADDVANTVRFLTDSSSEAAPPRTQPTVTRPPHSVASPSAGQPVGLYVVCAAEFCERVASCLLLSLLVLYFTERLGIASTVAVRRVGSFNAAAAGRGAPGAPRVVIRGSAFMGGVDVERVARGQYIGPTLPR